MMQDPKTYINFSVRDLICDEFFQNWVMHPDGDSDAFWRNWLNENPQREPVVNEARQLLRNLGFRTDRPETGKADQALHKAWELIEVLERKEERSTILRPLSRLWRAAAILILVTGTGLLIYFLNSRPATTQVTTAFGQLDSLLLPDQSLVVLNANSSIRYNKNWKKNVPREVWMKGEALFNVRHLDVDNRIESYERFLVHVERMTIEVLGTSFNIRQRREKIEVALLNGTIRILFENNVRPAMLLKPGDLVVLDTAFSNVVKSATNTENYSAWTKKRLVLNNPTLQEIVSYLEDTYGKKIILSDPKMAYKKVEGPILLDSLDDALFVLSTVLNVSIVKEKDTLVIRPK